MRTLTRLMFVAALTLNVCVAAFSQTPTGDAKELSTIKGRVTLGGDRRAPQGIAVVLMRSDLQGDRKPTARVTTDADGNFTITNIPAGRYNLQAVAPAYASADNAQNNRWGERGKTLNVAAGETIENQDIALARGGVITGRVTNADGKPVVEEPVHLTLADPKARGRMPFVFHPFQFPTDDRGIYRFYGVPPGRYLVSVGQSKGNQIVYGGDIGGFYPQTFHPNATEESQAKVIEVAGGDEVTAIDITLGKLSKTFEVAGRVVDEQNRPIAGAGYLYGPVTDDGKSFSGGFTSDNNLTNERGEFRAKGLLPGRWAMWAVNGRPFSDEQGGGGGVNYSDPVIFEIAEQNVSGLEIKMRRAASLSGRVVIEGVTDPTVLAKLSEIKLHASTASTDGLVLPAFSPHSLKPDGSFLINGLRPGKTHLSLNWYMLKGFSLLYVRRDGVEQPDGIEVRPGEQVRNVLIGVAYGTGVVRGQVQFPEGVRPAEARLSIAVRRVGSTTTAAAGAAAAAQVGGAEVDALGRFIVENLSAGEYEFTLIDYTLMRGGNQPALAKSRVNLTDGGEAQTTLLFDAAAWAKAKSVRENER